MNKDQIETHLNRKQSNFPSVCVHCGDQILSNEIYYVEVGNKEHLHSLIARKFCEECYTKYGEQMLLKGKKD